MPRGVRVQESIESRAVALYLSGLTARDVGSLVGLSTQGVCNALDRLGVQRRRRPKKHPLYGTWKGMRERCLSPRSVAWSRYGGRGIKVCRRWLTFANFVADMGPRPSVQHTLDRVDNSKGYYKSNCRWATRKEQQQNRRDTVWLTVQGVSKPIVEWSRETGVSRNAIHERIKRGMSPVDSIRRPT